MLQIVTSDDVHDVADRANERLRTLGVPDREHFAEVRQGNQPGEGVGDRFQPGAQCNRLCALQMKPSVTMVASATSQAAQRIFGELCCSRFRLLEVVFMT